MFASIYRVTTQLCKVVEYQLYCTRSILRNARFSSKYSKSTSLLLLIIKHLGTFRYLSSYYIDHIKDDTRFAELCSDSVFIANISDVNSNCTASKLCNLYSELHGDKDDITKCLFTIQHLDSVARDVEWAKDILLVQPQLSYICHKLVDHGYSDYWDNTIYPKLKSHIDNYNLNKELLSNINQSLIEFFLPESLPETQSKIYILDIENAFNLSDESFCCTPLILNPEIEKQLRLNFMNIYIHKIYIISTFLPNLWRNSANLTVILFIEVKRI